MRPFPLIVVVALVLMPGLASAKEVKVSIANLKYKPQTVEVSPGDTVVWTNDDDRGHTVVSDGGDFSSGEIGSGKHFRHEFKTAGEFSYHCDHHPRMSGRVVVKAK